jgi:hypothetical protein
MSTRRQLCLLCASALLYAAADAPWKNKQVTDWTEDDAKIVLADSPWAGSVTPTLVPNANRQRGGGMGRGGIGLGLPGMGRSRMGYPNGQPDPAADPSPGDVPVLRLRWESAAPIRDAEFKARETNAPDIDESSYAIAVYGLPSTMARGEEKILAAEFRKQAVIKREGQKDLKPSSVEVLQRDDGPVIVYLFPRKVEITRQDHRLEFDAQIAHLQLMKAFYTEEMTWHGKLEL